MSTTTQNLGKVGLVDHGVYSQTKEYNRLDFVTDENNISTYLSLVDKNVGNPLTDTTKWRFLAKGVANTPQEALDLILQADGPGSGLDADTLDGTQLEEIVNPEELASASPFDYFLGAKEVDGKWVFKKMAPTEVATVVAGSIGVSSKSQWGLMPASTYSKELASDYALYKISSYGNPWDRRAFSIVGAFNGSPYMFVGGCYTKSGVNEQVIDIRYTYTNPQFIKFYKKEGEVYVFCNAVSSNSNRAWFTSETGLTLISRGNANVIDESYTPIDVKSSVFGYDTIEELSTGVAGMIGFDKGRQVIVEHLSSSDNIDNIRSYIGNYMWWGGSSAPSGTFPVSMQSNLSLMLFVRSVGGMSIQTMYTGVAASGIINHKYERVYTDVWGKWTDMGTINSPH